jgi:hypothetical protein
MSAAAVPFSIARAGAAAATFETFTVDFYAMNVDQGGDLR